MLAVATVTAVLVSGGSVANTSQAATTSTHEATVKTQFSSADPGLSSHRAEPRANRSESRLPLGDKAVSLKAQIISEDNASAAAKLAAADAAHRHAVAHAKAVAAKKAVAKKRAAVAAAKKRAAAAALKHKLATNKFFYAQYLVTHQYGWSYDQYSCVKALWDRESSWMIHERTGSAYGIPQSLPGSKMAKFGNDWQDNFQTQIKWGLWYINDRYGSPCAAWEHSQNTHPHWY